jgi:hypothetical protein
MTRSSHLFAATIIASLALVPSFGRAAGPQRAYVAVDLTCGVALSQSECGPVGREVLALSYSIQGIGIEGAIAPTSFFIVPERCVEPGATPVNVSACDALVSSVSNNPACVSSVSDQTTIPAPGFFDRRANVSATCMMTDGQLRAFLTDLFNSIRAAKVE